MKEHNEQAFSILVHRHSRYFYNCSYRVVMNVQEAEDVVQEAFLKLWRNPGLWQDNKGAKFTSWFYKIVTNLSLDYIRKRKKVTSIDNEDTYESQDAGQFEELKKTQEQAALDLALKTLPEKQLLALNLCFYEDMSRKEAAKIIGVSVKALESLLMRAKNNIRDTLHRQEVLESKKGNMA